MVLLTAIVSKTIPKVNYYNTGRYTVNKVGLLTSYNFLVADH